MEVRAHCTLMIKTLGQQKCPYTDYCMTFRLLHRGVPRSVWMFYVAPPQPRFTFQVPAFTIFLSLSFSRCWISFAQPGEYLSFAQGSAMLTRTRFKYGTSAADSPTYLMNEGISLKSHGGRGGRKLFKMHYCPTLLKVD